MMRYMDRKRAEDFKEAVMKTDATRIYMKMETSVYMKKAGNPLYLKNVTKVSEGVYIFNRNYADLVNEAARSNGRLEMGFEPKQRPWGHWIEGGEDKIIEHTDKAGDTHYYLNYYTHDVREKVEPVYYVNGVVATPEELETIKTYEKTQHSPKRQLEAGVDEKDVIKSSTVRFDSIMEYEFRYDIDEKVYE